MDCKEEVDCMDFRRSTRGNCRQRAGLKVKEGWVQIILEE